jgi:deazaflavin-dependent oxidoreductase (nitroreductase family)
MVNVTPAPKRPKQLDSPLLPIFFKYSSRVQTWVYQKTKGRIGGKWRVGAGFRKPVPTLLLEHVGRKSGKRFTIPLCFMADGPDVIIVASQGGRAENPHWYRNLVAHPDCHIQIGADRRAVHAVTASPEQRKALWPRLVDVYADFDTYQSWTEREIPVIILQPRQDTSI